MSKDGVEHQTGLGRLVWGSVTTPRVKRDNTTKLPVIDPKTGKEIMEISFGVAYPKAEFAANTWPVMAQEIASAYPSGIPGRFAYKYVDGDTVDSKGVPYSNREGYAGCIVLGFTQRVNEYFSSVPIFKLNPTTGGYDQLAPEAIKCGDYVSVATHFKCEPAVGTNTPSIYVNPRAVEWVAYGPEIVTANAIDPKAAFGGRTYALPPGASTTPVHTPGAGAMPGMGAAPPPAAPGGMPGMTPPPAMAAPPPPPPMAPPAPPAGPVRPTDPAHIHAAGTPGEHWLINNAWVPAPQLPPPAPDFVAGVTGAPAAPGMPAMPGMPPR
jgi:hypothetical protein